VYFPDKPCEVISARIFDIVVTIPNFCQIAEYLITDNSLILDYIVITNSIKPI